MEGMVTDLQLARDKQQNFDEWKREHAAERPLSLDLSVTVLTTGFWPSYKASTQFARHCHIVPDASSSTSSHQQHDHNYPNAARSSSTKLVARQLLAQKLLAASLAQAAAMLVLL